MPRSPDPQTVQPHRQPQVRLHALQLRVRRQRSKTSCGWNGITVPQVVLTATHERPFSRRPAEPDISAMPSDRLGLRPVV